VAYSVCDTDYCQHVMGHTDGIMVPPWYQTPTVWYCEGLYFLVPLYQRYNGIFVVLL